MAPEADEHAVRARPVRWALGAALLAVLIAGACARRAEIKLQPVGKQPSKREQAEIRRRLEQLSGVKMSDEEFASLEELFPMPGPEDILRLAELGAPGLEWLAKNQVVVFRRPLAALDAAVRQRFSSPAAALLFVDAKYSLKHLKALAKRILSEQAAKGITEVSIEADGSGVRIVTPDARRVRRQLQQRYGPAVIVTERP